MEKKTKNPLKSILTIVISLAFAGFFLWFALKGLDFKVIQKSLSKANYWWVAFAACFGIAAYWFRAIRWNLMLEPMGHRISNSNSLWSISFGYLMNLTIPRSGEVARATALYGVEKVPVDQSFGTIILERVVDLVCMLCFLGLTLIFKGDVISSVYKSSGADFNPNKIVLIIGILLLGAILFFILKKRLANVPVLDKIIKFIDGILDGLTSIFKLKQKGKFILYTIGIWVSYYFAAYLVCFALPETSDFTFDDGFLILVVGTFGMIIPASGGIGAFNLAMKYGFMALFISIGKSGEVGGEVGLTYSFISLPLQIFIMLVMGLISIPMLAKERNKIVAEKEFAE
ncbi:lysylphosphatidylglycerol synthase transmembrane domain-containing protein [Chryseobacterium salviniae]|uniref:Lysylphosphatidylglycerol synthase transmembrane domain-containing protein n=1 Tax=Chryseobacterium salviniae TaxID=3101750 RepID=A0ABU6HUT0_9FLAO|nr:lysylphosphatidylglycerol synthase transmembrane domain-containing protein [Chryseobacterium sp. T9W2-O]MEC3876633.1 lysylphosphatidylglycerol synthase transmembrane domain-containing protein [Chryseobacterium sp. T9W2-O]